MYLLLATFICILSSVKCMVCFPEHPQSAFCRSDYVIRGKVLSQTAKTVVDGINGTSVDNFGVSATEKIKVYVLKVFKGGNLLKAKKDDTIYVDIQNPWQHKLLENGNYLLTGNVYNGQASISMCNWYERWHKITIVQKWGLKKYYALNCHCKPTYCPAGEECDDESGCKWIVASDKIGTLKSDCKSRISICMYFHKFNQCSWLTPRLICREPPIM